MALERPVALVTGASSGIGLELARLLAADGHDLVLVARRADAIDALAREVREAHGRAALALSADLAEPDAAKRIVERLSAESIEIDVLVNNAGFGGLGRFDQRRLEDDLAMIQVNITSLVALTRLLLPGMVSRGRGRIMNVASTAAFQPGPLMAVYYATKAFVLSFSEAIADELRDTGVTVTALCPGPTRTGFQSAAGMGLSPLFKGRALPDGAAVAREGYPALKRGQRVVVTGLMNRVAAQGYRFLPRRVLTTVIRKLQETKM